MMDIGVKSEEKGRGGRVLYVSMKSMKQICWDDITGRQSFNNHDNEARDSDTLFFSLPLRLRLRLRLALSLLRSAQLSSSYSSMPAWRQDQ